MGNEPISLDEKEPICHWSRRTYQNATIIPMAPNTTAMVNQSLLAHHKVIKKAANKAKDATFD